MNKGLSPSRQMWNRVMTALVWASAVLVMVLVAGIIGTLLSVWLYYNFCGWLNILNCPLPPVGTILVLAYFMNKEDFETDQPKLKTVDWFAVAGVILGAIVANLLHWGIASINGMAVAAVCYCVGQAVNKRK